jgi:Uma2 family endonuclease
MAIIELSSSPEHLLVETDWAGYLQVLEMVGERHLRVAYDRGKLELMPPSFGHEGDKSALGRMVEAILDDLESDAVPGGSTTFKRQALDRGFEPDECYWIANWEKAPCGRDSFDAEFHPPPDLVVEVERTRTVLNRLSVMAAFGVPEVWRWTRQQELRVLRLTAAGEYVEVDVSPTFPHVPLEGIARYLRLREEMGQLAMLRAFRQWLRSLRQT